MIELICLVDENGCDNSNFMKHPVSSNKFKKNPLSSTYSKKDAFKHGCVAMLGVSKTKRFLVVSTVGWVWLRETVCSD